MLSRYLLITLFPCVGTGTSCIQGMVACSLVGPLLLATQHSRCSRREEVAVWPVDADTRRVECGGSQAEGFGENADVFRDSSAVEPTADCVSDVHQGYSSLSSGDSFTCMENALLAFIHCCDVLIVTLTSRPNLRSD